MAAFARMILGFSAPDMQAADYEALQILSALRMHSVDPLGMASLADY